MLGEFPIKRKQQLSRPHRMLVRPYPNRRAAGLWYEWPWLDVVSHR
jgi:hypothetical protein